MSKAGSGATIISVSPFRCRMWSLHDRAEDHITEESCREEIASFSRHGQLVAALGRRLHNDPTHEFELVFGARRLFVARHLNIPLRVEVRELNDREAIVAMDIENRQRLDISPYERGLSYARWLRESHFSSQDDIASALKISASQVSRLLKIARLPPVIVGAFHNPAEICEGWGLELAAALENPERRADTINKAREILRAQERLEPREVCRRLLSAHTTGRRASVKSHDEVVLSEGKLLFRIKHERAWVNLRIPVGRTSAGALCEIRAALKAILQTEMRQVADSTPESMAANDEKAVAPLGERHVGALSGSSRLKNGSERPAGGGRQQESNLPGSV
jgi:ParB family transcriptional regulator, chromosome partitioning protein